MEPWMGQLGIAGVMAALLLFMGKTFISSVDRRITEAVTAHDKEIERMTKQHERELGDMRERAVAWEATANRREATVNELVMQNGKLQGANETAVQLLRALHQAQGRELEQR